MGGNWPRGLPLATDHLRGRSARRWQPYSWLQGHPAGMAAQTPADSAAALPQVWYVLPVSAAWGGWTFGGCDERSPCVSTCFFLRESIARRGKHKMSLRPFADLDRTACTVGLPP